MRTLSYLPVLVALLLVSIYGCGQGAEDGSNLLSLSINVTGASYFGTLDVRQVKVERNGFSNTLAGTSG